MTTLTAAATGITLALVSSAHCAVMCGPLALAARLRGGVPASLSYVAGRMVGYGSLGALAGGIGHALLSSSLARYVELGLSWLFAALLLLSASRQLRSRATTASAPIPIGKKPKRARAGRFLAAVADEPLLLGVATALLPCGVLFMMLTAAAKLGTPWLGAVALGSFALASAVVLVATSWLGDLALRRLALRRALGVALLLGAGLTVYRSLPLLRGASAPLCHLHAARAEAP